MGSANRLRGLQVNQTGQSYSGLRPTPCRGSGLDYDDSRHYQPGDDLRHINWRQTAKSTQIFTSIFTEEHEPVAMLVLDRRAPMRFGTRERLKVTRAAEICCYLAGYYHANGYAVGILLLQAHTGLFKPVNDRRKILEYLQRAVQACPPVKETISEPSLLSSLTLLQHHGYKGAQVIVISDLHDIGIDDRDALAELGRINSIHCYQVIDPVEVSLPRTGVWSLEGHDNHEKITLDANDNLLREQYEQLMIEQFNNLDKLCAASRIPCVRIMSQLPFPETISVIQHG